MIEDSMDPLRLDVAAVAAQGLSMAGTWPVADLTRLAESHLPQANETVSVGWAVQGDLRPITGGSPEIWLHLQARSALQMCCQRCLGPVRTPIELDRWVRFVSDEESAAALDAESEDDVLALQRWMDLRELIEDELLLALPLVPRHEVCPAPLPLPSDADVEESPLPNPFAVLAKLRKGDA